MISLTVGVGGLAAGLAEFNSELAGKSQAKFQIYVIFGVAFIAVSVILGAWYIASTISLWNMRKRWIIHFRDHYDSRLFDVFKRCLTYKNDPTQEKMDDVLDLIVDLTEDYPDSMKDEDWLRKNIKGKKQDMKDKRKEHAERNNKGA